MFRKGWRDEELSACSELISLSARQTELQQSCYHCCCEDDDNQDKDDDDDDGDNDVDHESDNKGLLHVDEGPSWALYGMMCYYRSGEVKHSLNFLSLVDNKWLKWIHFEAHNIWQGNLCHFQPFFGLETLRILQLRYCTAHSIQCRYISRIKFASQQTAAVLCRMKKWKVKRMYLSLFSRREQNKICLHLAVCQPDHCTLHSAHCTQSAKQTTAY